MYQGLRHKVKITSTIITGKLYYTRKFPAEDFSKYNRIAVNIYPEFRGFRKLYLTLILHNEDNVPDQYGKEGMPHFKVSSSSNQIID